LLLARCGNLPALLVSGCVGEHLAVPVGIAGSSMSSFTPLPDTEVAEVAV
jgi:hypothetical protein